MQKQKQKDKYKVEEQREEQKGKERATFTRTLPTWTDMKMKMHLLRSSRSEIPLPLPRLLCTLPLGLSMHDPGDNTSPELHSLFILIYTTNHLFIHMIFVVSTVNNATTNAAISNGLKTNVCGVVVERGSRAQSDNVAGAMHRAHYYRI